MIKKLKYKIKPFNLIMLLSITLFFLGILGAVSANQSTIYVSKIGNDSWNGEYVNHSPDTLFGPKLTIKNATGTVLNDGIVNIAPGTYQEHNIIIDKNMTVNGSGNSFTIINGTNIGRIFNITDNLNIIISNLTITGGKASDGFLGTYPGGAGGSGADGGAIYNQGTLSIINCVIQNNTAGNGGKGGSNEFKGTGTMGGTGGSGGSGGAIFNSGTLTITNTNFKNNYAGSGGNGGDGGDLGGFGGFGGSGGAICNYGALIIINSNFTGNHAGSGGRGGIDGYFGGYGGLGGSGGAIYNFGTLTISNSNFPSNQAGSGGDGTDGKGGLFVVISTIGGDGGSGAAGGSGGAIFNFGVLDVTSSSFSSNNAGNGGNGGNGGHGGDGVDARGGGSGGSGGEGGSGGAIYNQATVTIRSSIICNNYAGKGSKGGDGGRGGDGARAGYGGNAGQGGQGGSGGAIYNGIINNDTFSIIGTIDLADSTLNSNYAGDAGNGGNAGRGGHGANAKTAGNGGSGGQGGSGGAIYNQGILTIQSSKINSNHNGNGGYGGSGGHGGNGVDAGSGGNGGKGGQGGFGGAIYNNGTLDIVNSELNYNFDGNGGNGGSGGSGGSGANPRGAGSGGQGGEGGFGGAIYNQGILTIRSSNFTKNIAGNGGVGGSGGDGGDAKMMGKYGGNGGSGGSGGNGGPGGVIYNEGILTARLNDFTSNSAGNGSKGGNGGEGGSGVWPGKGGSDGSSGSYGKGGTGGAICNQNGTLIISNNQLINNKFGTGGFTGYGKGGAICTISGYAQISFNRIIGNSQYEIYCSGRAADARYNWWGTNENPDKKNKVESAYYDPWFILTIDPPDKVKQIKNGEYETIRVIMKLTTGSSYSSILNVPIIFADPSWGSYEGNVPTIMTGSQAIVTYHANGNLPLPNLVEISATVDGVKIITHLILVDTTRVGNYIIDLNDEPNSASDMSINDLSTINDLAAALYREILNNGIIDIKLNTGSFNVKTLLMTLIGLINSYIDINQLKILPWGSYLDNLIIILQNTLDMFLKQIYTLISS